MRNQSNSWVCLCCEPNYRIDFTGKDTSQSTTPQSPNICCMCVCRLQRGRRSVWLKRWRCRTAWPLPKLARWVCMRTHAHILTHSQSVIHTLTPSSIHIMIHDPPQFQSVRLISVTYRTSSCTKPHWATLQSREMRRDRDKGTLHLLYSICWCVKLFLSVCVMHFSERNVSSDLHEIYV